MGSVMAQSSPAPEEPLQAKERGQEVPVQHVHSVGTHRHTHALPSSHRKGGKDKLC